MANIRCPLTCLIKLWEMMRGWGSLDAAIHGVSKSRAQLGGWATTIRRNLLNRHIRLTCLFTKLLWPQFHFEKKIFFQYSSSRTELGSIALLLLFHLEKAQTIVQLWSQSDMEQGPQHPGHGPVPPVRPVAALG